MRWLKFTAARQTADRADQTGAPEVTAMAVFFSGGSIAKPGAPEVQAPPDTARKLVAGAVKIAVVSRDPQRLRERYQQALACGRKVDL